MNELFLPHRPRPKPGTTQVADGLPRRQWTVDEMYPMLDAGIIDSHDRFELIGGELVAMAAMGRRHELVKIALNHYMIVRLTPELRAAPETPLRLGDHDEPEPEFLVYPAGIRALDVRGDTVLAGGRGCGFEPRP